MTDLEELDNVTWIFPSVLNWKGQNHISDLLHSQVCEAATASWPEAAGAERVEEKLQTTRDCSEE